MAYPYQITDQAFLPEPYETPGPYEHNGNLYVTGISHPSGTADDKVRVFKSTDNGATWAEQDSANAKLYYQSSTAAPVDTFRIGTKLKITYVPQGGSPGTTQLHIAEFNMATDLWGTVITGGPTPGDDLRFKCVELSTGVIRMYYSDLTGASRIRVSVAEYNGSWGSSTILFNPGVSESQTLDYRLQGVVIDADNNVGICCHTNTTSALVGNFRYIHHSAAGVVGTFMRTNISTRTGGPPPISGPPTVIPLSDGGSRFVFPVLGQITSSGSLFAVPGVVIVEPGATPDSIQFSALLEPTRIDSDSFPFVSSFYVASQSALFLYYPHFDGTNQYKIKRSCSKGAGWLTPVIVFTAPIDSAINALCAQVVNDDKVGIVFSSFADNATVGPTFPYKFPQYYQEDLPTCGAINPCEGVGGTGARFNIR